jgi:hypothetical protein
VLIPLDCGAGWARFAKTDAGRPQAPLCAAALEPILNRSACTAATTADSTHIRPADLAHPRNIAKIWLTN